MRNPNDNLNTPRLQTQRLTLRRFTPEDTQALFDILRDPKANTFLPWFPLRTLGQARQRLEEILKDYARPQGCYYAICLARDNVPIGYVGMSAEDSRDFGYGLREEFWHRGIATEAAQAVVQQIRTQGVPYITATHDRNNPRSGAVMQKLGMTYRYSYEELWQPKNIPVVFRMYQLDFAAGCGTYQKYWEQYPHFVEDPGSFAPLESRADAGRGRTGTNAFSDSSKTQGTKGRNFSE